MKLIYARNVSDAYQQGMNWMFYHSYPRESRFGPTLAMDGPVTTVYDCPRERVLFCPTRDANPFFHFMEGLWMLAGRDDVAWLSQFNENISQFSDDGIRFHGAYGKRWISHFASDQIAEIIRTLKNDPDDRRCVLTMWDPNCDLSHFGKDIPCNTHVYFRISVANALNMTVCNRSNDMIWGAYGANAVHFSMLQEFMASAIGVEIGRYWQVSNDLHVYTDIFSKCKTISALFDINPYPKTVNYYSMVNTPVDVWLSDLHMFMSEGPIPGFRDSFFRRVVSPIWRTWKIFKDNSNPHRIDDALNEIQPCPASDWRLAIQEWLERRKNNV